MSHNSNKIIAFNYFGGKYFYLDELYSHFPEHHHFVDLFTGSMGVTLNKEPSALDTANDLNGDIINFFRQLRDNKNELIEALQLTPIGREEYESCWPISTEGISDLERARRFFVRCRQSFQGSGLVEHTGFNRCVNASTSGLSQNVRKFLGSIEKLEEVVIRLKQIQIEQRDYQEVLDVFDQTDTFFYVDPPYELRKRNYKKIYAFEFTDADHEMLAEKLHQIKGMAMVSMTDSEMYDSLYSDWNKVSLKPKSHSMKIGKQTENIWMNYEKTATRNLFNH